MIEQFSKETCKCCGEIGTQENIEGIKVLCPACGGKGFRHKSNFEDLPPGAYLCVK